MTDQKPMNNPDIVWITADSVRRDRTSLSNHSRSTTPSFNQLASRTDGREFSKTYSHGIWTRASTASILTGTYVSHHQTGHSISDRLPDGLPTVPELLSQVGYQTICISHNTHITEKSGLARGFDEYHPMMGSKALKTSSLRSKIKYALRFLEHSGGFTTDTRRHPMSYVITELAKERLDKHRSDPKFLYVHYNDTHHPYLPPKSHIEDYLDSMSESHAIDLSIDMGENLHQIIAEGCPYSDEEWEALTALYDSVLRYTDEQIGRLIDYANSTLTNPVVVLSSDHGELFGESGLLSHILLTDEAVSRVPLVVKGPTEIISHGNERVQHIDVVTTLLNEIGCDTTSMQGVDLTSDQRKVSITQRAWPRAKRNLDAIANRGRDSIFDRVPEGMVTTFRTDNCILNSWDSGSNVRNEGGESIDDGDIREFAEDFFAGPGEPFGDRQETELTDEVRQQLSEMGYLVD